MVDLDFVVGTLRCEDSLPTFDFTQRLDPGPEGGRRTTLRTKQQRGRRDRRRGGGGGGGGSDLPSIHESASLARIGGASRTVRIGVERQPPTTTTTTTGGIGAALQQGAVQLRRGRGGVGSG